MKYTCKVKAEVMEKSFKSMEKKSDQIYVRLWPYTIFSVEEKLLPSLPAFKDGFMLLHYNNTKHKESKLCSK